MAALSQAGSLQHSERRTGPGRHHRAMISDGRAAESSVEEVLTASSKGVELTATREQDAAAADGEDAPAAARSCSGRFTAQGLRRALLFTLLVPTWWAALWLMSGDAVGLPGEGGFLFALAVLFPCSVVSGMFASDCLGLPPLLGMLLAGFALRNITEALGSKALIVDSAWSSALKSAALVIILARAGLGLKLDALRRLSAALVRLIFLPNVSEAVVDAALSVAFFGMPWTWALALGFVISAVSPAVVVPSLLSLQERRYGTEKGIPTLVLAAASFDDVLSISAFGICIGFAFSTGDNGLVFDILRAPLASEVVAGLASGLLIGLCASKLAPLELDGGGGGGEAKDDAQRPGWRAAALMGGGMLTISLGRKLHFTGAGALSVIVSGVVAAQGWGPRPTAPVQAAFKSAWSLAAQPLLFVLIGSEVSTTFLDGRFVGQGLVILLAGLTVRLALSFLSVCTRQFERKERLFIALAWFPKATVQAAIGATALDMAKNRDGGALDDEVKYGQQVLTLAVLSIMITAPIGAALIAFGGPRLLERESAPSDEEDGSGKSV